jgi:MSHA pilin protein MshD
MSQRAFSLLELIIFIAIVGVGIAGILSVLNVTAGKSADPLISKQALSIAEALMEEIRLMPFTYCDPDDPQVQTATTAVIGATGCQLRVEAIGADVQIADPNPPNTVYQSGTETRASAGAVFDNVNDYHGYTMSGGVTDIGGSAITGLGAYSANVTVNAATLGAIGNDGNGTPQVLRITVIVSGPGGISVTLDGYRVRYAPNTTL